MMASLLSQDSPGETGIDERVFFADLLDFLIWEDYGLTNDAIQGYFRRLNERQADICVEHLRLRSPHLFEDDLEYQSEEVLTFLGMSSPSRSGLTSSRLSPGRWSGRGGGSSDSQTWR